MLSIESYPQTCSLNQAEPYPYQLALLMLISGVQQPTHTHELPVESIRKSRQLFIVLTEIPDDGNSVASPKIICQ